MQAGRKTEPARGRNRIDSGTAEQRNGTRPDPHTCFSSRLSHGLYMAHPPHPPSPPKYGGLIHAPLMPT